MSRLDKLPDEILLLIIEQVYVWRRNGPMEGHENAGRDILLDTSSEGKNVPVCYELNRALYVPNITSLLAVNQHLRQLTRRYTRKASLEYDLDVMLMEAREIWPTWTCIPYRDSRRIADTVRARIFCGGPGPPCMANWSPGDCGPPPVVWSFLALLDRFCKVGPVGPRAANQDTSIKRNLRRALVHVLDIDCIGPEERLATRFQERYSTSKARHEEEHRQRIEQESAMRLHKHLCRRCDGRIVGRDKVLNARWLCHDLRSSFMMVLDANEIQYLSRIVFISLGKIIWRINGIHQEHLDIDLGEVLAHMPRSESRGGYQGYKLLYDKDFQAWRNRAKELRIKNGLSMPGDYPDIPTEWEEFYHSLRLADFV